MRGRARRNWTEGLDLVVDIGGEEERLIFKLILYAQLYLGVSLESLLSVERYIEELVAAIVYFINTLFRSAIVAGTEFC
jgi:hypothetical protein